MTAFQVQWSWKDHKLLVLAGMLGVVALVFAALNLLVPTGWTIVSALVVMGAAAVLKLYERLPENRRAALLSRRFLRRSATFSLLGATGLSCFYWLGWLVPLDLPQSVFDVLVVVIPKLDYVPSLFSLMLPADWRSGFHQWFRGGTYCFPGPFWWETMRYLRAAIPGYFLVFMGAALAFRFVRSFVQTRNP